MNLVNMSIAAGIMILISILIRYFAPTKIPRVTFVFIWGLVMIRLLIPFEMPFGVSLNHRVMSYHLVEPLAGDLIVSPSLSRSPMQPITMEASFSSNTMGVSNELSSAFILRANVMILIWLLGMGTMALYFVVNHFRFLRYVSDSIPLENDAAWRIINKYQLQLKRKISIRQSQKIVSPLTYGVIKPVILVPKMLDCNDLSRLEYVLAHEFIHIKRVDCLVKAIAALVLCVHWFNPFVWVMYVLIHRDIELACDEKILKLFGEQAKSTYALTLIELAEKQNNFMLTYSYFSKHVGIEKRIKEMAKMKKKSIIATAFAVVLVGGAMVAFASGENTPQTTYPSETSSRVEINERIEIGGFTFMEVDEALFQAWAEEALEREQDQEEGSLVRYNQAWLEEYILMPLRNGGRLFYLVEADWEEIDFLNRSLVLFERFEEIVDLEAELLRFAQDVMRDGATLLFVGSIANLDNDEDWGNVDVVIEEIGEQEFSFQFTPCDESSVHFAFQTEAGPVVEIVEEAGQLRVYFNGEEVDPSEVAMETEIDATGVVRGTFRINE